jgi:hypothetical protein
MGTPHTALAEEHAAVTGIQPIVSNNQPQRLYVMATCSWPLGNGESLDFTVYDQNEGWNKVAGLYIFSYLGTNGLWQALYVGQTDDFSSRLPSHEKLNEAVRRGATHIHALVVSQAASRDKWEQMLIQNPQPPLNVQLR